MIAFLRRNVSKIVALSALYVGTFLHMSSSSQETQLVAIALAPVLILISVHDLESYELPDMGAVLIVLLSLVFLVFTDPNLVLRHAITGIFVCASFWVFGAIYFHRTGTEGLGIGDAKLFGAGAFLLGPWQLPELLFFSSLGGIIFYMVQSLRHQNNRPGIPFGPFIAYAIFMLNFLDPIFL